MADLRNVNLKTAGRIRRSCRGRIVDGGGRTLAAWQDHGKHAHAAARGRNWREPACAHDAAAQRDRSGAPLLRVSSRNSACHLSGARRRSWRCVDASRQVERQRAYRLTTVSGMMLATRASDIGLMYSIAARGGYTDVERRDHVTGSLHSSRTTPASRKNPPLSAWRGSSYFVLDERGVRGDARPRAARLSKAP
ncbi:hypothetical protein QF000_001077 [Paraburkholderia atlantica]